MHLQVVKMAKGNSANKTKKKIERLSKLNKTQKTREVACKSIPDVYWATIKDKYIFSKDKKNEKSHTYAIYTDSKTKENRIVQAHHLYNPDKKNMEKVKKGLCLKVKTTQHETVSGLDNFYYNKTIDGKSIDFSSKEIVSIDKTPINKKLAKQILDFANKQKK